MALEPNIVQRLYSGSFASQYETTLPDAFSNFKRKAYQDSKLKKGDHVLVFCCGTGMDFPYILKKIGKEGKITGVDFSADMLKAARDKIDYYGWDNIELIEADVTTLNGQVPNNFDAGVCTLGLSIIKNWEEGYANLVSHVKPGGEIIIGDMQLATGRKAYFNRLTVFISRNFGGTTEGHGNSLNVQKRLEKDLSEMVKKDFFLGGYYYCVGRLQRA